MSAISYTAMLETSRTTLAQLEAERTRLDQQEQEVVRQIAQQRYQLDAKAWAVRGQIELLEQLHAAHTDRDPADESVATGER